MRSTRAPYERFLILVLILIIEGGVDRLNQVGNTVEHTQANSFIANVSEPTLDQIQPRTGSGNIVQMEPRMAFELGFDPRMLYDKT